MSRDQMSLFGERPVPRETAIEKLEEIKRAIAGIPEPTPRTEACIIPAVAAFDEDEEENGGGLCRRGNMAFPRHADGPDGTCKRCGSRVPKISVDRTAPSA